MADGACLGKAQVCKVWRVQRNEGKGGGRACCREKSGKEVARLRTPCPQPIRQGDMGAA